MQTTQEVIDNLTVDAFREFLLSKDLKESMGLPNNSYGCPIYQYLQSRIPVNNFYVSMYNIVSDVDYEPIAALPSWCADYVMALYRISACGHDHVTVQQCLDTLDTFQVDELTNLRNYYGS